MTLFMCVHECLCMCWQKETCLKCKVISSASQFNYNSEIWAAE